MNSPTNSNMSTAVTTTSIKSNDLVNSMILSPPPLSPPRRFLKTIHLNTQITPIDTRTTAICPSSPAAARSRRLHHIQSDGQDDSHSPPAPISPQTPRTPSPGSQGHPRPVISSAPPTPSPLLPWPTSSSPSAPSSPLDGPGMPGLPGPRLQRAVSNPSIASAPIVSPTPSLRRRLSASPPPSKLQTIATIPEPLRRQGSNADLSPIDECRASECDGKRKIRLEKEARERELALMRAQVQFFSDGSEDDDGGETADEGQKKEMGKEEEGVRGVKKAARFKEGETASQDEKNGENEKSKKEKKGKKSGLYNCVKLVREKSYGRVFDDPFSAAVVLLVLPFCPPLSVYLTFRECGGLNRRRAREVSVAVLLTVLGWVPGVVYALVIYFRHLPRPPNSQEDQALHLSPRQRSGQCSDKLS